MADDDATQGDQTQAGGQPIADPEATDPGNDHRPWWIALIVAVLVVLLGGGLAVALSGGDDDEVASDATTTSSSSTSSSSTTAATVPSAGGGGGTTSSTASNQPTISLSTNPNFKACTPTENWSVTVSWSTTNATSTTLSVDGPGIYGNYGPSGSVSLTPGCNTQQHTYTVKATGPNGQATKTITFNVQEIPTGP